MTSYDGRSFAPLGAGALCTAALLGTALLVAALPTAGGQPANGAELLTRVSTKGWLIHLVAVVYIAIDLCLGLRLPAIGYSLLRTGGVWPVPICIIALIAITGDVVSGLWVYALPALASSATTSDESQQAALIAAQLLYAYIYSAETRFYVAVVSLAIVAFGVLMLRAAYPRWIAYLGIGIGLIGSALGLAGVVSGVLVLSVWFVPVAVVLWRRDWLAPLPAGAGGGQ